MQLHRSIVVLVSPFPNAKVRCSVGPLYVEDQVLDKIHFVLAQYDLWCGSFVVVWWYSGVVAWCCGVELLWCGVVLVWYCVVVMVLRYSGTNS